MIGVSTSSYYGQPKVPREKREQDDAMYRNLIEQVQEQIGVSPSGVTI